MIGEVSSNQEIRFVRFHAKSIKHVVPLAWSTKFYQDLVQLERKEHQHESRDAEPPARVLPQASPALKCPASGPPSVWITGEGGYTDGCLACRGLQNKGSRKGLVHSKSCCKRYEKFLEEAAKVEQPDKSEQRPDRVFIDLKPAVSEQEPSSKVEASGSTEKVEPSVRLNPELEEVDKFSEPHEPSLGDSVPAEETVELDEELSERIRHDKRLDLEDVGSERPVKRRMVGKRTDTEGAFPPPDPSTPRGQSLKRPSDMNLRELEEELKKDDLASIQCESLHWVSPFMHLSSIISQPPSVAESQTLSSVRFANNQSVPESAIVHMGGMDIKVWCPSDAVDDTTGEILDGKKCHLGMQKELEGLEECKAGDCYTFEQFEKLKATSEFPIRLISTRWVTTAKGDEVRSCMVVKDVKSKDSARSLGISSPTLGADAFNLFLTIASAWDLLLFTLDVSHAFMYTPLRRRDVAVKLPMSCSTENGQAIYLHLSNALNGLRSASLEWLLYLQDLLSDLNLRTDGAEPCYLAGRLPSGRVGMIIVYVDDLMVAVHEESDFQLIQKCLRRRLKVKHTGTIYHDGGRLVFLGREILRLPGERALFVHLPDGYLDKPVEQWGLKLVKGAKKVPCPNLLAILDQGASETEVLIGEAYQRFRSTLGKLAWMSQTRQDLKHFIALLGTVQAAPTQCAEKALRSLLRYLVTDQQISLRIPSENVDGFGSEEMKEVWSYTDASHAPSSRNRRGVSGGVLSYLGGLVKTYSRHQTSVSLSSCEAELQAIQTIIQETIVLARLVTRIMRSLGALEKDEFVVARIHSDSESALKIIKALDLPRRSRHIDIKVEWMRELIANGLAVVKYLKGTDLVADALTKCLASHRFLELREVMGFVDKPLYEALMSISSLRTSSRGFALLEVCCDVHSQLRSVCQRWGIPYRGITYGVEMRTVYEKTREWVKTLKVPLHVHLSTLCSSGSPLRRFANPEQASELDASWDKHIAGAVSFMLFGRSTSFELPLFNNIWKRWYVQQTLKQFQHDHFTVVHLCQTGLQGTDRNLIGKRLKFTSCLQGLTDELHGRFGVCRCPGTQPHANFNFITWRHTALYSEALADAILTGLKHVYGQ